MKPATDPFLVREDQIHPQADADLLPKSEDGFFNGNTPGSLFWKVFPWQNRCFSMC